MEKLAVGISEAATVLGVGRDVIYALLNSGELPSFKVGARRLIPVSGLRAYVERHTPEPQPVGAER